MIARLLWPYRVVSLLRPQDRNGLIVDTSTPMLLWFYAGSIRTFYDHNWRAIVFHLLDVVPLIIVDRYVRTSGVQEELEAIERRDYKYKLISVPRLTGNVAAKPQILRLTERLANPNDVERRLTAQEEFTRILLSVPLRFRYAVGVRGVVIRSRFIMAHEEARYLHYCKGVCPSSAQGRWLADIPSVISKEEEEHWLVTNRGLEEVRRLLESVREAVVAGPERNRAFNLANCLNNLGKLDLIQQRFDEAFALFNDALEQLQSVSSEIQLASADAAHVLAEESSTHFMLAQVCVSKYRRGAEESYKKLAEDHLRESIRLDQAIGHATEMSERLLRAI